MPGYWEFPGGKLERGEDAWQALVRELKEELAIAVLGGQPLMVLEHGYPDRRVRLEVWQVNEYLGCPVPQEGQQVDWCEPRQLEQLRLLPADAPIVTKLLELAET